MKRLLIGLTMGVICALAGLIAVSAEAPAEKSLKPCVAFMGVDSHVTKPRDCRITSPDEWTRLWQEHKGKKPTGRYDQFYDPLSLPAIDFDRYMVIVIFEGGSWQSAGVRVDSISEENERIVFRFSYKVYQVGPGDVEKKATAYGFFVVPRSTKPVVLEEGFHSMNREVKPVWEERITFPKL